MATCQQVVDKARETGLNDADKTRYPDTVLMRFLQDGVARAHALRPDLRFGAYLVAQADLTPDSDFPLPMQHESVIADYIIARAEMTDDENVNANRETKAMQLFEAGILRT